MNSKDKKILALMSGGFLTVLALVLFVTIQSRDNLISNTGRVRGMEVPLGDTCSEWGDWSVSGTFYYESCSENPRSVSTGATATECEPVNNDPETCGESENCYRVTNYSRTCEDSLGCDEGTRLVGASCEPCGAGEWSSGGSVTVCSSCPAGYACEDGTKEKCPDGKYSSGGRSNCLTCSGNIVQTNGLNVGCNTSSTPENPTKTAKVTCISPQTYGSTSNVATCENCYFEEYDSSSVSASTLIPGTYIFTGTADYGASFGSNSNSCSVLISCPANTIWDALMEQCKATGNTTGCNPGEYYIGLKEDQSSNCIQCPGGYVASEEYPYCHIVVPAGSYLVNGSSEIRSCPAGTYADSPRIFGGESSADASSCTPCPNKDGKPQTSPIGSTSSNQCYVSTSDETQCIISASTTSKIVSKNAHYTVKVSVSGNGCNNGQKIYIEEVKNAEKSGSHGPWTATVGQTLTFDILSTAGCNQQSSVKAILKNSSDTSQIGEPSVVTVSGQSEWQSSVVTYNSETYNSSYHTREDADANSVNVYYEQGSDSTKMIKWSRNCGSSGGSSEPEADYCWVKKGTNGNTNEYTYGTKPGSGWEKYGDTCPITACYYNPTTGVYTWTNSPSYDDIWITSKETMEKCKTPVQGEACYINEATNDYRWDSESPGEGYEKNSTINTPSACAPAEAPACYENLTTGNREWGLYGSVIGYNYISNNKNDCAEEIPNVPPTATNISTIIYVSMAIFGSVGIGFIVYSNYRKEKI